MEHIKTDGATDDFLMNVDDNKKTCEIQICDLHD